MTTDVPPDTTAWRRSLRDLAAVIGPAPAQRLAEAVAGVETHIPKRADPLHPLAAIIGMEAMQALVKAYGGQRLDLPKGMTCALAKVAIMDAAAAGTASKRDIALTLGVTQRYVRLVTNQGALPSETLDLFGPKR